MSEKGSVFQKGGGGTNFEQFVQCGFLTTLILRGSAPSLPSNNEVVEVAFQTTRLGYETDDLYVVAKSIQGTHRLLAQIKHNLTFSEKDGLFKKVISDFWKDFNNKTIFDAEKDRLLLIKSGLNDLERNHIKAIFNFAKSHATATDFIAEINRIKEKKERLAIFRNVLKEANSNTELNENQLWSFLKCVDLLEYDFLNTNSIDETYFLNLIKLSKNKTYSVSEKDIWNAIYILVSKLNKDGGNITAESVQKVDVFQYFNFQNILPIYGSVEKLRKDGNLILKPIKNVIKDYHIKRNSITEKVVSSINCFPITVITGRPGVGKSALAKEIITSVYIDESVFVFRADQFNQSHLANVFSNQGINESIQDIFSCISLITDRIIVIDSLEKLLEGDPENAFKQLISLIAEYDLKILTTSRHYAIDLVIQKFKIDNASVNVLEVDILDDEELNKICQKFPSIQTLLTNRFIKNLLRSPKYLEFAISTIEKASEIFTELSLREFKNKLWYTIVEDITTIKNGLSGKRRKAFSSIAIKRAKEMSLFVEPDDDLDFEAIEALEKDEVIFRANSENKFSPSHDILEDWALVRYIDSKYNGRTSAKNLFESIGNEPAIRRAFRLWIDDYLIDDFKPINELIHTTLDDNSIEKYWCDELLIAVFRSDNCFSFFNSFKNKLLENNNQFLNKCIHLLTTACKESSSFTDKEIVLMPVGSGWAEMLIFISDNIGNTNDLRYSILNFIFEWQSHLWFNSNIDERQLSSVRNIIFTYLGQIENGDSFWDESNVQAGIEGLVLLLFDSLSLLKENLAYINQCLNDDENRNKGSEKIKRLIVKGILSFRESQTLAKIAPQLIVDTAWKKWKFIPKKFTDEEIFSTPSFIRTDQLSTEECWGIKNRHDFFPSGIYKTPFYNVLTSNPLIGLEFLVSFINYSVNFYANAKCDYKHRFSEVMITLNDGTKIKQFGAPELWMAYRGLSVTHYLLESLLMSLEMYLLNIAKQKNNKSKENLKYCFDYLLKNSNNVAITAVLTSVAIAYPEEVDESLIPLLTVKEFYDWDANRSVRENSTLSPIDRQITNAQQTRYTQNQLPHRRKYFRGLRDFILDYQFNVRYLNKEIHNVFDKLKINLKNEDIIWKKTLTEIDLRNHKVGDYDKQLGGFPILPEYDNEVTTFIEAGKEEYKTITDATAIASNITEAYKHPLGDYSFLNWEEWYNYYQSSDVFNMFIDKRVSLAIVGLRNFANDIDDEQLKWCINTLVISIDEIVADTSSHNFDLNKNYNLMEKEIALSSFHWIYYHIDTKEDIDAVTRLIIYTLIAPFADRELEEITAYFRNEFAPLFPEVYRKIWIGLIKYSKFRKRNKHKQYYQNEAEVKKAEETEAVFISDFFTTYNLLSQVDTPNFATHEASLLGIALLITPYKSDDIIYSGFIGDLLMVINEDLKLKENYSYNREKNTRQLHYQIILAIKFYLAELLVFAKVELRNIVIDKLLIPFYQEELTAQKNGDSFEFVEKVLEYTIYKIDEISSANANDREQVISDFWITWGYLSDKIHNSGKSYFTSKLLLDVGWGADRNNFIPFEQHKQEYEKIVKKIVKNRTYSLVKVLSTIGEKQFLPDGILWISNDIRNNILARFSLRTASGERLIERLFYNHISTIKSNQQLVTEFLCILDIMIDLDSSKAYFFRENTITYKRAS